MRLIGNYSRVYMGDTRDESWGGLSFLGLFFHLPPTSLKKFGRYFCASAKLDHLAYNFFFQNYSYFQHHCLETKNVLHAKWSNFQNKQQICTHVRPPFKTSGFFHTPRHNSGPTCSSGCESCDPWWWLLASQRMNTSVWSIDTGDLFRHEGTLWSDFGSNER